MSIETPQAQETTPVVTKPVDTTTLPTETSAPVTTEPATTVPETKATEPTTETETAQNEAIVTAVPATEGVLGYKGAPGLLNKFRFVKHFFWLSDEPLTQEGVDSYIKSEKAEIAHHNAAWAQETGKGVLFYAKRAEDKATPSGLILLPEATNVTKIGNTDFTFKVGSHTHKFEAYSSQERDSWVVAIEKIVEESKDLKADITGRESYKKTIEGYAFSPAVAGASASTPVKAGTPKKSLDAGAATSTEPAEPAVKADASSASSVDESKKNTDKQAKKERSQSRKRASVFGLFGKKDEDKEAEQKKQQEKAEKKAEKEHAKEVKKAEAEQKKEEAKAEHDAAKAKEAAEAAAIAAAPAAVAASVEKKEEKHDDKPVEEATSPVTSPTEKKAKRASVFGGFFGNKNKVASPSSEKAEKDVAPEVPAKDDTPAVSETAPKIEEPIATKPIDAAAVTAPVDAAETSTPAAVPATEEAKPVEPAPVVDSTTTPKTEKKSFFTSFIKKDKKEEPKEEKTNEEAVKEIAPVTAAETTTEPATTATEPAVETPVKDAETAKDERPAREKRRTSLFGSLGTLKRKTDKSPEPTSAAASTEEDKVVDTKREKSPLPSKLGGLFRKPSRAAKTELSSAGENKTETTAATDATTDEAPKVTGDHETPANATIVDPSSESKIVGDVVPENLHSSTVHDAVTTEPEATKTTV